MWKMTRRDVLSAGVGLGALGWIGARDARAAADPSALSARAVDYLRPKQADDGSWSGQRKEPGITALVVTALLRSGRVTPEDPAVTRGLGFLERYVGPKGGLSEAAHSVYSTSVALMAFHEANKSGRYDAIIKGSQQFLRDSQLDEGETRDRSDPHYGGMGYGGGNGRPDLSNTAFMVEALHDSGVPADDPALKKALIFVSRCQNLKSEFNDQPWADKINDGGFVYAPPGSGPQGKGQGKQAGGGLRSTAGMTYSGLKSMLYAGLKPDDARVKAAVGYIKNNYTLDENPGSGQRGLYYYYLMFARAMAALGQPAFVDASGMSHDWKAELAAALAKRQEPSGAWANKDDRFMEGDPNIVTSYALMALAAR